jgi:hypothetical protein
MMVPVSWRAAADGGGPAAKPPRRLPWGIARNRPGPTRVPLEERNVSHIVEIRTEVRDFHEAPRGFGQQFDRLIAEGHVAKPAKLGVSEPESLRD